MALVGGVFAESVFVEDFEKASAAESVGMVDGAAAWQTRGNRPLLSVMEDTDGLKAGNALRMTKGLVFVNFPEVELAEGDSLEVSFRYRFPEALQETGFPFRVGVAWDESGNPAEGNTPGYWFMSNPGAENGLAMINLEEGTDGSLGGGSDIPILAPQFQTPASGTGVNKLTLTVARPSGDGVDVSARINDDSPNTRTDTAGKVTKFNVLALSIATNGSTEFLVDDVNVTVNRKAM